MRSGPRRTCQASGRPHRRAPRRGRGSLALTGSPHACTAHSPGVPFDESASRGEVAALSGEENAQVHPSFDRSWMLRPRSSACLRARVRRGPRPRHLRPERRDVRRRRLLPGALAQGALGERRSPDEGGRVQRRPPGRVRLGPARARGGALRLRLARRGHRGPRPARASRSSSARPPASCRPGSPASIPRPLP